MVFIQISEINMEITHIEGQFGSIGVQEADDIGIYRL